MLEAFVGEDCADVNDDTVGAVVSVTLASTVSFDVVNPLPVSV